MYIMLYLKDLSDIEPSGDVGRNRKVNESVYEFLGHFFDVVFGQ